MENAHHEPPPHGAPRPCSTPHSAPLGWLRAFPEPGRTSQAPSPAAPPQPPGIVEQVLADPALLSEILSRAPSAAFTPALTETDARDDGWTGERMARFLEVLADTGLASEACRAVGMSRQGVYPLRNRDPVFAAAWRAALTQVRPQVADGLLERSITGTVEHYYRDGVLVGERRHYESWLGLAVLRRLDKIAADDRAEDNLAAKMADGWQATLAAMRGGGAAAAAALWEVDEVDTPPSPPGYDPSDEVWLDDEDGVWMTVYPPPPDFDGFQNRAWNGLDYYERSCTSEEVALIEGHAEAEDAELRAEAEAARERWFAELRRPPAPSPQPASVGAGVSDRIFREGVRQRDRTPGDGLPMVGVELVEPPCSDEAAQQPDEDEDAECELHRLEPPQERSGPSLTGGRENASETSGAGGQALRAGLKRGE